MTIYQLCLSEALNYTDRTAYISDLALSSAWGDDDTADIPASRLDWLGQLWDAAHRTPRDILSATGMTRRALSDRFAIPYRTVQNWCLEGKESRACPLYLSMMMQELLGLLTHDPQ